MTTRWKQKASSLLAITSVIVLLLLIIFLWEAVKNGVFSPTSTNVFNKVNYSENSDKNHFRIGKSLFCSTKKKKTWRRCSWINNVLKLVCGMCEWVSDYVIQIQINLFLRHWPINRHYCRHLLHLRNIPIHK